MAALTEVAAEAGGEIPFDFEGVWLPLVVVAGLGEGSGQWKVEVEDAEEGEDDLGDDGRAAGGAEGEDRLAFTQDEGGAHAGERAFAGGDGVGFLAEETEVVGHPWLEGEVVHLVVEDDAGAGDDDFGAERSVDGGGAGDPVALGVGGREMGCVGAEQVVRGSRWGSVSGNGGGARWVDGGRELGGVGLVGETAGDGNEVGVPEPIGAVGEGAFHGFGDEVKGLGGAGAEGGEVEVFEDVEDLGDVDAAGAWGREADDLEGAVTGAEGGAEADLVVVEVGGGEDTAVGLHPGADAGGEGAAVEPVGAALGDGAVGGGEVGLAELGAGFPGEAFGVEEDGAGGGEPLEIGGGFAEAAGVSGVEGEAAVGEVGGGEEEIAEGEATGVAKGEVVGGEGTGDPDGEGAGLAEGGIGAAMSEEEVAGGGGGGGFAAIEGEEGAVGTADEEEAAAAEAGVGAVDDAEGEGGGDRGVDGVAALAEGIDSGLRGEGVDGGDDAVLAAGGMGVGGREGEEEGEEEEGAWGERA